MRRFLWIPLLVGCVLLLIGFGVVFVTPVWAPEPIVSVSTADQPSGSVRFVDGLWVARLSNGEWRVFLNLSPHGHHPYEWIETEQVFRSPSLGGANGPHDEVFHLDGACMTGPCRSIPPAGLYRVQTELTDNMLVAYPFRLVSGGYQGDRGPDKRLIWRSLKP